MRCGTMFRRGSLLLIPYPFTDFSSQKRRPVLALTAPDEQGDFIGMPVTSKGYHPRSLELEGHLQTGTLPRPSWVRTDKVVTLQISLVIKCFAQVQPAFLHDAVASICSYLES